jgi:DNA adenine methylase
MKQSCSKDLKPVLKWAGGKRQLIDHIVKKFPKSYNKFIEPFIGGGALFFYLNKKNSIISDINEELINLYKQISKNPKKIISRIKNYKNTKDDFYNTRKSVPRNDLDRACRTIYLNKTCFNGLYRVNQKGEFNVPYGNYKNVNFFDEKNLIEISKLLKQTQIIHGSYETILKKFAMKKDLIFLDPPYLPISKNSDFKRYNKEQFYFDDHKNLANLYKELDRRGCYLILTNSNSERIIDLYKNYKISIYSTKRNINNVGNKRVGKDIIVTNF